MLDYGFYNMDCMEGMKQFPDKYFDLAIVDPPYGINIKALEGASPAGFIDGRIKKPIKRKPYKNFDDSKAPTKSYWDELFRVSKNQIIWGGNYFLEYLPATNCLIVWDKGRRQLSLADCEIAWTSFKEPARIYEYKWNGMLQEDMKKKETRIHPTQKPVALYKWLLENYANAGDKILDTHVGSGSSLIACHYAHCPFVGFEIDQTYYQLASERFARQTAQIALF